MKIKLILTGILLLALFLRVFKLGSFPATLYGDEQAFSWNAFNILKTGADEYGTHLPLEFRSFDDYKAPIPVYLLVPFIKFFGFNTFTIRLPIALGAVLTVFATYLLARTFLGYQAALLMAYLLAISPWHIHLSRGYFEATLSLLFFVTGMMFVARSKLRTKLVIPGIIFFALSVYSYFTPRILIPLSIIFLILYYWLIAPIAPRKIISRRLINYFFKWLLWIGFLFIVSCPLVLATFSGKGLSRWNKLSESFNFNIVTTVNKDRYTSQLPGSWKNILHNKATVRFDLTLKNYLEHLSANFWYIYGDSSLRYFLGNTGMFYLAEFPFLIAGLYALWREKRKALIFFVGWILVAPIPASLVGRPFGVRSVAMLPAPFAIVGYGIYSIVRLVKKAEYKNITSLIVVSIFVISLGMVLTRYYFEYPVYAATWWGWENKAALDYARARESSYDYIFISDFYTGAPLAYAVYTQADPVAFQQAQNNPIVMADGRHLIHLGKYYFGSLDINEARLHQNIIPPRSLYIGRPAEVATDGTINAPDDGRLIFNIITTK